MTIKIVQQILILMYSLEVVWFVVLKLQNERFDYYSR
jgi:hypothetical protein